MKTKTLLIAFVLLFCTTILWASNTQVDGIWYDFNSSAHTASVTFRDVQYNSYDNEYSGQVTIPSVVNYNNESYCVTSIGNHAFAYCSNLTSITVPNSVTSIEEWAFWNCTSLTSITIPNSVTSIGKYAFWNCTSLSSITIPNSVTSIGKSAFQQCTSLSAITIPDNVTSIEEQAFYGCSALTSVEWNAKTYNTATGYGPFQNVREQITIFTFGDSIESIPNYLCYGMPNLSTISIPNSVTSLGNSAFYGCSGLTTIAIPNAVTNIGDCAFKGCSSITSIVIPDGVVSIGESAFENCSGLTDVTIGKNVKSVGKLMFKGCEELTNVIWKTSQIDFQYRNNPFYYYEDQYSVKNFDIRSQITSFVFDSDMRKIPAWLCTGMNHLTSITIPNGISSIGSHAFEGCRMSSVIIPNNIQYIRPYAFADCIGLTNVNIPSGYIGEYAFSGCSNLISVTIGEKVFSIETHAFYRCLNLSNIIWNASRCHDFSQNDNLFCFIGGVGSSVNFDLRNQITSFVFGDKVKRIPDYLCYGLSNATFSPLPNSLTEIGSHAFQHCRLPSLVIPNGVTTIGGEAFFNASVGDVITIPDSVTTIGIHAFHWTRASSVVLGNRVDDIGIEAFYTHNLDTVIVKNPTPPRFCGEFAFGSYSVVGVKIFVPCGSLNTYKGEQVWGEYSVQYLSANINAVSSDENRGIVSYPQNICETPQISATPNEGYHFTQWDDGNTDNPRTIDINEEKTYTASFDINMYQVQFFGFNDTLLSKQSVAHGTAAMAPEVPSVDNYEFIGWDKDFSNVINSIDVHAKYVEKSNGTENIPFENHSFRKVFHNGQLYIFLPDGTRYDATGKKVE